MLGYDVTTKPMNQTNLFRSYWHSEGFEGDSRQLGGAFGRPLVVRQKRTWEDKERKPSCRDVSWETLIVTFKNVVPGRHEKV